MRRFTSIAVLVVLTLFLPLSGGHAIPPLPLLHPLFSDHMVAPRGVRFPVWGWAAPGTRVTVEMLGRRARAVAGASGRWEARLGPVAAHGSTTMRVTAGARRIVVRDVLVGDVWLCSGQSNMEWGLRDAANGPREVARANVPLLRLFRVSHRIAFTACNDVEGRWEVCTPGTAANFSAVGYFFGRDLTRALHRPIGLVESAWGGTRVEAWMSREAFATLPDQPAARRELWLETLGLERAKAWEQREAAAWWKRNDTGRGWEAENLDTAAWKTMVLPTVWEKAGYPGLDGVVWFRREVHVPVEYAGRDVVVHLGPIDDGSLTFFNGELVGACDAWDAPRDHRVPGRLVKAGRNVIAVRVLDARGDGGLYGKSDELRLALDGEHALPLSGPWRYRVACELTARNPLPPSVAGNPNLASVLYNGMISPLVPYAIAGAIWYQGESNATQPAPYRRLLAAMIGAWRSRCGRFPFLVVSLAGFDAGPAEFWPSVREAQMQVMQTVPRTATVQAVDIGEAHDIHPKNKQEVGRRLALAARATVYGEAIEWSGPLYAGMGVEHGQIRVRFTHARGLHAKTATVGGFEIAGADRVFAPATAVVDGATVCVSSPTVPRPVAVRYAWANSPTCSLYNGAGLPAAPFRTDDWGEPH